MNLPMSLQASLNEGWGGGGGPSPPPSLIM